MCTCLTRVKDSGLAVFFTQTELLSPAEVKARKLDDLSVSAAFVLRCWR
jgi:hypothetical protein